MDIQAYREMPHLSPSSISDYMECGLLYRFSRVDKKDPDHVSDNLVFGSAIHQVLAEYNRSRLSGERFQEDDFTDRFSAFWEDKIHQHPNILYSSGNSFSSLKETGITLLKTFYHEKPEKEFEVVLIEEPVIYPIGHSSVSMLGFVDLVEKDESGTIIITDYKTTARAYTQKQVNRNLQLTAYYAGLARDDNYERDKILLKFDCLIKTRTPKFVQYYTTRDEADDMYLIRLAKSIWEGIEKEIFIPNPSSWRCNTCGYQSHCKNWFYGKDIS